VNMKKMYLLTSSSVIVLTLGFAVLGLMGAGCSPEVEDQDVKAVNPDVALIQEVFMDNYPEAGENVRVEITETDGEHVKGNVVLNNSASKKFYAVKLSGDWSVIYKDEPGEYDCELLRNYEFTENMIMGCKDPVVEFTIADAQGIQKAFADKYHKNVEDITIKVDKYTALHARGTVQFSDEPGGGLFLAVKEKGEWDLVFDGNGMYGCEIVESYNFPEDMVADCNK
jgi:Holliday junction resolvase